MARQKVTTFLWLTSQADEAANLYVSLFPDSRINEITPGPDGGAWLVDFTLAGVRYLALNGGPHFQLTEAASLSVDCETQEEIDDLWAKLTEGGTELQCGWLKDRFGVTWQIVPSILSKAMSDPAKAGAVMQVVMPMKKLDIKAIEAAYHSS